MSTRMALCRFIPQLIQKQLQTRTASRYLVGANRCFSCSSVRNVKKPPHVKPPGKMKLFAEKKYLGFTERMEKKLESRYPKAHKLFVLVKTGMKTFFSDTKILYTVSTQMWKGKEATEFSYLELEVYRQMPGDMVKVFPVLAIAALPFAPYFIFPVAYLFPRHLLSRHFWTEEQQLQFGEHYLRARVPHYPKVLHYMEKHSRDIKDPGHRRLLENIIYKLLREYIMTTCPDTTMNLLPTELEQNSHPSIEEIIEVKPVFRDDQPFGRSFLASRHKLLTRHLAKSLDLSAWSFSRMSQQALLLHDIDLALAHHGVDSLTPVLMRQACFLRGLNAAKCSDKDMLQYLQTWLQVSQHTDETSLSLLLHSPVLLAMNHPANANLLTLCEPLDT